MQTNPFVPGALSVELTPEALATVGNLPFSPHVMTALAVVLLDQLVKSQQVTTPASYTPNFLNATEDGQIPSGSPGWSISALAGDVAVEGQALPVGASVGDSGGTNITAINYTVSAGGAALVYFRSLA